MEHLGQYGLLVGDWTTVAGGESNEARVDQILSYVTALDVASWAVVDDEAARMNFKVSEGLETCSMCEISDEPLQMELTIPT